MNNSQQIIRPRTVKLISTLIRPWVNEGIIHVREEQEMLKHLRHLAKEGSLAPTVKEKLIDQRKVAELLGIGYSNFKKQESNGAFPFKRKMVGAAIRYRNTDIINFILDDEN